jgi:hypothetical protein
MKKLITLQNFQRLSILIIAQFHHKSLILSKDFMLL